jgi:hypothetical protein
MQFVPGPLFDVNGVKNIVKRLKCPCERDEKNQNFQRVVSRPTNHSMTSLIAANNPICYFPIQCSMIFTLQDPLQPFLQKLSRWPFGYPLIQPLGRLRLPALRSPTPSAACGSQPFDRCITSLLGRLRRAEPSTTHVEPCLGCRAAPAMSLACSVARVVPPLLCLTMKSKKSKPSRATSA